MHYIQFLYVHFINQAIVCHALLSLLKQQSLICSFWLATFKVGSFTEESINPKIHQYTYCSQMSEVWIKCWLIATQTVITQGSFACSYEGDCQTNSMKYCWNNWNCNSDCHGLFARQIEQSDLPQQRWNFLTYSKDLSGLCTCRWASAKLSLL